MAIRYVKDFQFDRDFGFTGSATGRHDARNHPTADINDEYGDGGFPENPPALAKEKGMAKGGGVEGRAMTKPSPAHPYNNPRGYAAGGAPDTSGPLPDSLRNDMESDWPKWTRRPDSPPTPPKPGRGYDMGGAVSGSPMGQMTMPSGRPQNAPPPTAPGPADASPLSRATISMPAPDAARMATGLAQAGRAAGVRQAVQAVESGRQAGAMARQRLTGGAQSIAAVPRTPVAPQGIPQMRKGGSFKPGGEKGKLHRELGVPEGQKIPTARLSQAAHSNNPEVRRDAIRAETMKKWHHGKK